MNPSKEGTVYLNNLNPLRGVAALLVVFYHVDAMLLSSNLLLKYKASQFVSELYLMVDFFFILSGFVLLHVYKTWFTEKVQKDSFWRFTVARFARVYPLHFFILIAMAIGYAVAMERHMSVGHFAAYANTGKTFIYNLLLVQSMNVYYGLSWNYAAWSISTEWWMYIIFPFTVSFFLKLSNWGRALVFLACIGGYLLIMFYLQQFVTYPENSVFFKPPVVPTNINVTYQFGFVRCFCGFTIGMIAYLLYKDGIWKNLFSRTSTFIFLLLCTAVCMNFAVWNFITVIFFALIILSAAYGSKKTDRFFELPWLQQIGDWSYSIYMVHIPLLFIYTRSIAYIYHASADQPASASFHTLTSWLIALSFFTVTITVSAFTYRFVELPCRKWINRKFHGHYASNMNSMILH